MAVLSKNRLWCLWLLLAAILLEPASVSAGNAAEFDSHVERAERHVAAEHLDQAIVEYEAAYALKPEGWLLINIGRAHVRAHRPREALTFYNRALKVKLTQNERMQALASAQRAQQMLDEQKERAAAEERRVAAEQLAAQEARLRAMEASQRPLEEKPVYKKGWFWGVIIGSVAVTGLALGLGLGLGLNSKTSMTSIIPGPDDNVFPPRSN